MKLKGLSRMEMEVMKILWKESPLSVAEVVERMEEELNIQWAYNTSGTILRRMEKKGYVHSVKRGAAFYYSPALKASEVNGAASFVENYFQGSIGKFLKAFAQEKEMTQKEFEELKEWVRQHDDDY